MKKNSRSLLFQAFAGGTMQYLFKARKVLLGLLLFGIAAVINPVSAGGDDGIETSYFARMTGTVSTPNSLPLSDPNNVSLTYTTQGEHTRKILNIITFSVIEETPKFISANFTATVTVRIDYGPSSLSYSQYTHTFTVDYNKNEGAKYNAKNYFSFENAEYVRITIVTVNAPMVGSLNTKDVLLLQNEMRVTRYFELANNVTPITFTGPSSVTNPIDTLPVSWSWPANAGLNHTQLEWTWLENELAPNYYLPNTTTVDVNKLFKNNATRVDLPYGQISYNIPLFYDGTGQLYYRIRAVNIKSSGNRSDGPWSTARTCSYAGHESSLNWQSQTSFAERGLSHITLVYYDGSLRSRQTVTKENINNTTISSETFYDEQGRAAIQILPAPSMNTVVAYTKNLNLFNGQVVDSDPLAFFDLQLIASPNNLTPALSTTTGASKYYSPANPEIGTGVTNNIPDAEGYPYSVTRYTPDATGRIMAQSNVGSAMKMGSGRETKYYYGTPAQEELDALFGTEVGNYTHYAKNMVKDANGQMSVAYVDMHGRTIATALAGDTPSGLVSLNTNNATYYPGQAGSTITRNLLDNNSNVIKNNSIESITSILVPATTIHNFQYQLNPEILQLVSCTGAQICYDCMYNLEISITDESGDAPPIVKKFNNINLLPDDNCATPITQFSNDTTGVISNMVQFSIMLPPGSYAVRKTLTISEGSVQKYKELYLAKGLCKTQQQLIDSVYNVMLAASDCDELVVTNCQTCLAELGTYQSFRANYLNSIGNPNPVPAALEQEIQSAFNVGVLDCNRLCNNTSQLLASKRQLMLMDMMPDEGQYARRFPTSPGSMYNKYDIFSTVNPVTQPFYKKPWNSNKQPDYYYDAFNVRDVVIHPQGATDPYAFLNSTTGQQFSEWFSYNWASALLPHHPEYDRLVFAENNLDTTYKWINKFSSTSSYLDASGFPNPNYVIGVSGTATPHNDPFYTAAPANYKNDMLSWVTTNYQNGWSMWQIARGDVKCKSIMDATLRNNCYNNGGVKIPPFADVTTATDRDQMWKVFRNLYAAARNNQVNDFIVASVPLSDATTLISQGYKLHFGTNNQTASQYGWTWYPSSPGANPNLPPTIPQDSVTQNYSSRCNSYIDRWKQWLLQCPAVAALSPLQQNLFLTQVTNDMVAVCIKGSDAANPFGSSTMAPSTPNNGSPRSFEEVIDNAFNNPAYGITRSYLCNPYMIEFPKPYGKGPRMATEYTSAIDTCNCSRFDQLKSDADIAGYDPDQFTSLNQYFNFKYGDTITLVLYNAMQHCNELGPRINCYTIYDTISHPCNQHNPCLFSRTATQEAVKKPVSVDTSKVIAKNTKPKTDSSSAKGGGFQCFEGYHWDPVTQQCVPDGNQCLEGYHWDPVSQQCVPDVPQCLEGYHWDPITQQCVPDILLECETVCPRTVCDTIYNVYYPLSTPQPLPDFMKCGFTGSQRCITCADLSALTAEFKTEFVSPYNNGPVFTGASLTEDDIAKNILFSRFINYRTGFQFGWMDYAQASASATPACNLANYASNSGATQTVICRDIRPLNDTTGVWVTDPPCHRVYTMAVELAQNIYQQRVETLLANFETEYRKKCMAAGSIEQFSVTYANKEYHYMLYYYDMANNLVKTVPPAGARPDFSAAFTNSVKIARQSGAVITRPHVLTTNYRYSSLNKVTIQNSPDGNTSKFWFDRLGRLVVSQNAQQFIDGKYSYTLYDHLGRIIELGQKPQATAMTQVISQDTTNLKNWIIVNGGTREQITYTQYDFSYGPGLSPLLVQQNLRNRVSYSATKNQATDVMHYTASFYSYDIHGNIDTLLQDYKGVVEMDGTNNRFKLMTYNYDIINGKVNMTSYQPGKADAFYHRYNYDAEARLLNAETSRDKIVWERDAAYSYYKHGSLARMELGQLRVQGMDYAYTLQGWLKGINSTTIGDGTYDIAKDGFVGGANSIVARDVLGFALHYYDNNNTETDYKVIAGVSSFARPASGSNFMSLYNSNIGAISMSNGGLLKGIQTAINILPLFYNYRYDALGRIISAQTYKGLDASTNQWVPVSINDYGEAISYDPNGNILTYNRKGAPTAGRPLEMDDLSYSYYSNTNRLKQVADNITYTANYPGDMDNQSNANNYTYDAIGNLKTDASDAITNITWNMYGKIVSIVKNGNTINYTYDAAGNRIARNVSNKTTIYVRDVQGNVVSVYEKPTTGAIVQAENHIYGNNRTGITTQLTVANQAVTLGSGYGAATVSTFTRNEKIFEMANHLQNVLVTVGDKKLQYSTGGTTVDYYTADIITATDYSVSGMAMPERSYATQSGYRYGFNGQEKSVEIEAGGSSMTAEFWQYDARIGRRWNVDPVLQEYESPYLAFGGNPILYADPNGDEKKHWIKTVDAKGNTQYTWNNDAIDAATTPAGSVYVGRVHTYYDQGGYMVYLWDKGIWNYNWSRTNGVGQPPLELVSTGSASQIDMSKIKPRYESVRSADPYARLTDFERGMIVNNIGTEAAMAVMTGGTSVAAKLGINTAVQVSVNGKNADVGDILINSFSPYTYANQWGTSMLDWKPLTGDFTPKLGFVNKPALNVGFDLAINHAYYGLGKLPVTTKPLTPQQKLIVSTVNTVNKAVVKKAYTEGLNMYVPPRGFVSTDETRVQKSLFIEPPRR